MFEGELKGLNIIAPNLGSLCDALSRKSVRTSLSARIISDNSYSVLS